MAREIPFSCIQMTLYESIKGFRNPGQQELQYYDHAINGSLSGGLAAMFTTPVDVIKTQLMTDRSELAPSMRQVCARVYKESGLTGFFRAWHVRSVNIGLCSIVFFASYETSKKFLNNKYGDK